MRKKRKDTRVVEIGFTSGEWTVVGEEIARGKQFFLPCRCSCGTERLVRKQNLFNGQSQSCGCRIPEIARQRMTGNTPTNKLSDGEASLNKVLYEYKRQAGVRGIEWCLSKEQCVEIFSRPCFYCGIEKAQSLTSNKRQGRGGTPFLYNGIDRVDNTVGYLESNVVPCCEVCNKAKLTSSSGDFVVWVERTYLNLNKKGML